jgi:S1-C subfamily serine protease
MRTVLASFAWLRLGAALLFLAGAVQCGSRGKAPTPAATAPNEPRALPAPVQSNPPSVAPVPVHSVAPLSSGYRIEDERNSIDIFRMVAPSTVFVTQKKVVFDYFAGTSSEVPAGSGSGFIWDAEGHVVTNFHVVKGAQSLIVTLQDHRTFDAQVVGVEPRKDIAVLRILDASNDLVPIRLRPPQEVIEVGQKAIAIGNPFGLDQTLTTGVVSALGREVKGIGGVTIRDMVQTDAAINPGNSGGPLLDSAGHLIGMNTMIFSNSGASAGIGFAVPVSSIRRVVPQIIATGRAEQVGLGVHIDPAQRLERRLGLRGVVILRVVEGSPAEKAGLHGIEQSARGIQLGDVIVGINEHGVSNYDDLYNALDRYSPGTKVKVSVVRADGKFETEMELVVLP